MAASDAAFVDAQNQSRRGRLNEEAAVKAEARQVVDDERSEILFNRETSLYDQQQKLFNDEEAQMKLGKEMNTGMALWQASGGQIFQPLLNTYTKIPDGGKMHSFARNEDGTYKIDFEFGGSRMKKENMTYDEASSMFMAAANPMLYLEQSGAKAEAEADHQNKLAQIAARNAGNTGRKATEVFAGGQFAGWTMKSVNDTSKRISEGYGKLVESMQKAAEGGEIELGQMPTFKEYEETEWLKLGVDITGARAGGGIDSPDAIPVEDEKAVSFRDAMAFYRTSGQAKNSVEELDKAIEAFIDAGRAEEALVHMGNPITKKQKEQVRRLEGAIAAVKGDEQAEAEAANDLFPENLKEGGSKVSEGSDDPIADYRAEHPRDDGQTAAQWVVQSYDKLVGLTSETFDTLAAAEKAKREKIARKVWGQFIAGKGRAGEHILAAAAGSPEGLAAVNSKYNNVRRHLTKEQQVKIDAIFAKYAQPTTAIPDNS